MIARVYGVDMDIPQGKKPGYYAQAVHAIGDRVRVTDRDGQTLIVDSQEDWMALQEILARYHMAGERYLLWRLPLSFPAEQMDGIGFTSLSDISYLYDCVAFFSIDPTIGSPSDRESALQQLMEHVKLSVPDETAGTLYIIEDHLRDLMEGIAKAYQIHLHWHGETAD